MVATWEEFIAMADDPAYNKAKCYYRNGQMRIETMSVGPDHARDNGSIFLGGESVLYCESYPFKWIG